MENLKYCLESLADLALPRCCMVCGRQLETRENHLCIYCSADFPFTRFWLSPLNSMADRFNGMISRTMDENPDRETYESYSYAAALFFYHGEAGYRQIPQGLKYRKRLGEGRHFARMLGNKIFPCEWFADVDMVVPVPLHWKRRWTRGYNQAEVIAAELAGIQDCVMETRLLTRNRQTATQTRLSVEDKSANVHGAFGLVEKTAAVCSPSHILLVDDVFTTGATITACHQVLRSRFGTGTRISAATLGFVTSG